MDRIQKNILLVNRTNPVSYSWALNMFRRGSIAVLTRILIFVRIWDICNSVKFGLRPAASPPSIESVPVAVVDKTTEEMDKSQWEKGMEFQSFQ